MIVIICIFEIQVRMQYGSGKIDFFVIMEMNNQKKLVKNLMEFKIIEIEIYKFVIIRNININNKNLNNKCIKDI